MRDREQMVRTIEAEVKETSRWIGKKSLDPRVMEAMRNVPRHEFVPPDMAGIAYRNEPLPIGSGQTISQPYIVALMTDLLAPEADAVVLEIGTGCGYQTAILSELVKQVYTIEVINDLGEQAKQRLLRFGYSNIEFRIGDGYHGWPESAPFNAIMVTAAAASIPDSLVEQLKPGGSMAIPVGTGSSGQTLVQVSKDRAGVVRTKDILPVAFVPLIRGQ